MAFCHMHDHRLAKIPICSDLESHEGNDADSGVEEVDNALETKKAVNGTKVDIVDSDLEVEKTDKCLKSEKINKDSEARKVEDALETKIVSAMISFCSMRLETEAVVRRGAVDALTRTLDHSFDCFWSSFGDEAQDSMLAKVVTAVGTASFADFDFDVKRKCVAFWKAFASKLIKKIAVLEKENEPNDGVSEGVPRRNNNDREGRILKEAVTEINDSSFKGLIDDMLGIKTENATKEGSISWRDEMDVWEGRLEAVYHCLLVMAKSDCEPCVQICAEEALSDLPR